MYYKWLFNTEQTSKIIEIKFDDYLLFHKAESLKDKALDSIEVIFNIESFTNNKSIKGHFIRTEYFPIVSHRFKELLNRFDANNHEFYKIKALAKDGSSSKEAFYIWNILNSYDLKNMRIKDDNCPFDVFRASSSKEYVTISDIFFNLLKENLNGDPWHVYVSNKYDFDWFKENHFDHFITLCKNIDAIYNSLPVGEAFSQIKGEKFITLCEDLKDYKKLLPNSGGGLPALNKLFPHLKKFKNQFSNQTTREESYWTAQEISLVVFTMSNYMETMCLE